MPVVNPGIRRYIGSAIQRLFNSASFSAPLTHSLTLERGTGSPTFTRATTATFQDNEGILRTAIAGEARFTGARRVRNLLTFTEDFSNAAWTKSVTTVSADSTIAPDGTASADLVTADVGTSEKYIGQNATSASPSVISIYAKQGTHGLIQILNGGGASFFANFDLSSGVVGNVGVASVAEISNAGNGWYRCSVKFAGAINNGWFVCVCANIGNGYYPNISTTGNFYLWGAQLEDITGRTDQTTPSEYVSVGVLSAPYHGAGADGVKYFDTDLSGNPIAASTLKGYLAEPAATNLCLQSNALTTTWTSAGTLGATQNVVGPDGAVSAWTLTDNDAAANEVLYQPITLTAANYTNHCLVKKTTGAQASYPCLYAYDAASSRVALCTIDTSNGVATVWTAYTGLTVQASSARCSSFNDDFWLVELTFLGTAATWTNAIAFAPAITTNPTQSTGVFDLTVQGSAVVCNFQCELGSAATSYIPTTTVAVTRNADVESVPTSGNIIAASGWISLTYTPTHAPSGTVFLWGTYVDASNYTAILHDATNLIFRKRIAGTNYDATIANAFVSGTTYKMAATWGASGTGIALNGTLGTGHANTTAAQIGTAMQTGADGNGANQPGMSLGNERIGQRQLSSSELQAITR